MRLMPYLLVLLPPVFALVAQQLEENVDVDSHVNSTDGSELTTRAAGWVVTIDTGRGAIPANVEFSVTSRTQETIDLFYFRGNSEGAPLTQACWSESSDWKTCRVFQYVFSYVRGRGHITAISRSAERQDLFFISKGSESVTLERWRKNGGWWGGTPTIGRNAAPGTSFGVVSRGSRKLEAFWARNDGALMHAYTENDGDTWVRDQVLDRYSEAKPESITAMSKDSSSAVVAWVTTRGALMVARYEGNTWVKNQVLIPGSLFVNTRLATLSISRNMMNIFFVGTDGMVYQSYWTSGMSNEKWTTTRISNLGASVGGISATSMNIDHMEVFWTHPSGTLHHAYWTKAQNSWSSEALPGSVGTNRCQPGSHIATVARVAKGTMEGWCRSIEGKLTHFYYYAK